jgi:CheY-like chemotaxis protein
MQEKGGVLTLSLSRMEPGAGETAATPWVRLSVRDTGCGMDAGVRSRLFEPLFTTKPAGIGSGLGLTMVRETVRACHGRIQVNSGPGQGSEFIIELPQPPVADTAPARGISGAVKAQDPARILFVDDEERIRISEKQLLEELGFQTDTAADAEEALRLHAEVPSRYRLVITDLNMPGGNGVELAESLHRLEPDLPIILTTGYSDMLQEIDAGRTGIRAVLSKPFDMEELYEALHELAFV